MNRLQIGVMGSAADLAYSAQAEAAAFEIGRLIAMNDAVLFFGAEKDSDSLSTAAFRGAKAEGGLTVGITYGKGKDIWQKDVDIVIPCGMERGGARETVLVNGCDAIIAIGGGSGTLTELAIAYQADIPMVALKGFGGWADRLADAYVDRRERRRTIGADSTVEAVAIALREASGYRSRFG